MKKSLFIAAVIGFLGFPAFAESLLVLGNTTLPPLTNAKQTGMLDLVVAELFGRVGLTAEIRTFPAERSLMMANAGEIDGELVRLAGISKQYPNLIQIPEKIGEIEIVAFTRKVNAKMKGWQSLKPYRVAYLRGWKILENNVTDVASVHKLNSPELLFNFLDMGRADIILYHRLSGNWLMEQMNLKEIRVLEPALVSQEMFLYVNKKHELLVPKLTSALKGMKQDGAYDRLKTQAVGKFLSQSKD